MPAKTLFGDWKSSAYTGLATVGTVETAFQTMMGGLVAVVFILIGIYIVFNAKKLAEDSVKSCTEMKKKDPDADCKPQSKNSVLAGGGMMVLIALVVLIFVIFNWKMTRKYKPYAAYEGVGAGVNLLHTLL